MGPCRLDSHPRSRRLRARRGRRAGRFRHRARALAPRRRAAQPGRLDRHGCAESCHRPHQTGPHLHAEDRASGPAAGPPGRGGRAEHDPGRPAGTGLHLLPSRSCRRCAGRADAPGGRRSDHDRDRPRLPGRGAGHGPAARPREAEDSLRRHPVPRAARPPAARPAARRSGGSLPRLQRGVCRDGRRDARPSRSVQRGRPAREAALRADARRGRGIRAAGPDALPRLPPARARHAGRRARSARRSGPGALGPARQSTRDAACSVGP